MSTGLRPIVVTTPDGTKHNFAPGTSPDVMRKVLAEYVGGGRTTPPPDAGASMRSYAPNTMTRMGAKSLPYVLGGAGAMLGPWGAVTGGAVGKLGEQAIIGDPTIHSAVDERRALENAGAEQGAYALAGDALAGGANLLARGFRGVAGWADRRAGNAAVARVRARLGAAAPHEARISALEDVRDQAITDATTATREALATTRESTRRAAAGTREQARLAAGLAREQARSGLGSVGEVTRMGAAAEREKARLAIAGARDIGPQVEVAVADATTARQAAAAKTNDAILSAHAAGAEGVPIQEVADRIIQRTDANLVEHGLDPMTTEAKADLTSRVMNRHATVMPDFYHGAIRGDATEHPLTAAQLVKQAFRQSAKTAEGQLARGKMPDPNLDLEIERAYQAAIEERVPEVAELNRATRGEIRNEQNIKAFAESQPGPSVKGVQSTRMTRAAAARSEGANAVAGVRQGGSDEATNIRRASTESVASIQREAAEHRAGVQRAGEGTQNMTLAEHAASVRHIKALHEAEVSRIRVTKAEDVARALATAPGKSDMGTVDASLTGLKFGAPKLKTLSNWSARAVGSRAARGTLRQAPRVVAGIGAIAAPPKRMGGITPERASSMVSVSDSLGNWEKIAARKAIREHKDRTITASERKLVERAVGKARADSMLGPPR